MSSVRRITAAGADGPAAGAPAVTRHSLGAGQAWYISTRLTADLLGRVLAGACAGAGVAVRPGDGVEVVLRRGGQHTFVTVINHGEHDAELPVSGLELLTGARCAASLEVPGGEVRVVRQESGGPDSGS